MEAQPIEFGEQERSPMSQKDLDPTPVVVRYNHYVGNINKDEIGVLPRYKAEELMKSPKGPAVRILATEEEWLERKKAQASLNKQAKASADKQIKGSPIEK